MSRTAPAAVRAALREGLALMREGYAGRGLRGETVTWAERLARGEPITEAKARKMRGWFARHGPPTREADARLNTTSPASVAWLLWGGNPAIPYRRTGWQDPVAAWLDSLLGPRTTPRRRTRRNAL